MAGTLGIITDTPGPVQETTCALAISESGNYGRPPTRPDGEKYHAWSQIVALDPPKSLEFDDGFLDDEGNEVDDMPSMTSRVDSNDTGNGTRMVITTTFPSLEAMEQQIEMGAKGMKLALGHVDALLAGLG